MPRKSEPKGLLLFFAGLAVLGILIPVAIVSATLLLLN
jgi:hypothetical protein